MAWTSPTSVEDGQYWTANQFNRYVRDNLRATVPGISTGNNNLVSSDAPNSLVLRRPVGTINTTPFQITTSSYVDTPNGVPSTRVTAFTGTSALVIHWMWSGHSNNGGIWQTVEVTGSTNIPADNFLAGMFEGRDPNVALFYNMSQVINNLNPGSNTFTLKHARTGAGVGSWTRTRLVVFPL